jgi:hypothetical protein
MSSFVRYFVTTFAFAPMLVTCQSSEPAALRNEAAPIEEKYKQLIGAAEQNNFDASKDPSATADLRQLFIRLQSPIRKESVCYTLLKMGEIDDVCRDFLSQLGQTVVDSDIPEPYFYDEKGHLKSQDLTPDFIEWAKKHNRSPGSVLEERETTLPMEMFVIAFSGDRSAIPLLRKGLSSSNRVIQLYCAQGLALLQDKDSIKLIIDAAQRLPRNKQWMIGKSLLYLNDPAATAAGEEMFADKAQLEQMREEIKKNGPLKPLWPGDPR